MVEQMPEPGPLRDQCAYSAGWIGADHYHSSDGQASPERIEAEARRRFPDGPLVSGPAPSRPAWEMGQQRELAARILCAWLQGGHVGPHTLTTPDTDACWRVAGMLMELGGADAPS